MPLFRREDRTTTASAIELRAPDAATRTLRYTTPGLPQPPDWDATQAFRIANNTVLTCVARVSSILSRLPFRVGADPNRPEDFDVNAPLARLLGPPPGGPNPSTSARRLWAWTVGQRMIAGRFGWEIETDDRGVPVALYALPASSLQPIPSTSGAYYFDAFVYGTGTNLRRMPRETVVYDWLPHPEDWRQPDPPLRAAHLDTLIAVMQSRYDYAFLKNDARPPAIIVTEEFAESDDFEAFKRQWNSTYGGPDNAGRIAFLESNGAANSAVDIKVLGISPRDAQAAERFSDRLEQIAMALGVPWSLLDASGRTFDNASQEWANFVRGTLAPLADDLADAINMQLAPRFGSNVGWFDLTSLGMAENPNPVTAQVGAPSMVQAQLMTINEARADYGLAPVSDGDRMMTVDEIAALRGQSPTGSGAARGVAGPVVDSQPQLGPAALPVHTRDGEGIYIATPRQDALYEAIEEVVETFGPFTQDTGPDGAHYVAESPFADEGMVCSNCIFYEGPRACEVVAGDIDPGAVCKFWVIPYPLVVDADGQPVPAAPGAVPVGPPTMMTAAHRARLAATVRGPGDTYDPPAGVRVEARRAVRWIEDGFAGDGFTATGRRRASQLADGDPVSWDTIRRMASYLARHEVDKDGEGWRPGEPGYPSPGRVAWAAWGGDPAVSWTRRVLATEPDDRAAASPDDAQARRVKLWKKNDARIVALERDFTRRMGRLFDRQRRAVIARLEGKRGRSAIRGEERAPVDDLFDAEFWTRETFEESSVLYRHIFETVAEDMQLRFGLSLDLEAPGVDEFIQARANQLAGPVTDTTYKAIQNQLTEGIANGESIPDLAKRITGVFDQASKTRAVTIARTETISAFNGSAMEQASIFGTDVVAGVEWLATNDGRTRDSHAAIDGQVIEFGGTFDNGLAYPGDPGGDPAEVVNCRCTVLMLDPDEFAQTRRSARVTLPLARAALDLVAAGADPARIVDMVTR